MNTINIPKINIFSILMMEVRSVSNLKIFKIINLALHRDHIEILKEFFSM